MTAPIAWTPYCGRAPMPGELMARWNLDPVLIALLGLSVIIYIAMARDIGGRRRACFAAALVLAFILFISPFCALSSALFSARVIHHVLLGAVVSPLLVASLPRWQVRDNGSLGVFTAVQAAVFWLWHAPPAYAWALSSDAAYWLMQASLLLSASAFWNAIRSASAPAGVVGLLATMVQMGLLGALITFASVPLYAPHLATTRSWDFSSLEDQQLAGLIMWAPSAALYLGAALLLLGRWLGAERPVQVR